MRRPLLAVGLCFIGGILLREYYSIPLNWQWGCAGAIGLCSLLSLICPAPSWVRNLFVLLLVAIAGIISLASTKRPPAADDIRLAAGEKPSFAMLRGVIDTPPEVEHQEPLFDEPADQAPLSARTVFDLCVTAMRFPEGWRETTGKIRATIYEEAPDLRYGDEIEISGSIRRPPPPTNPGQFDYGTFLEREGIFVLAGTPSAANVRMLSRHNGFLIKSWVFDLRQAADAFVARNTTPRTRSILACMLLGYRRAVSGRLAEAFVRSGTAHVLAISGLHLMILAGTLWWVLCMTPLDRRLNAMIVLLFVAFYVVMTGMRAPVVRAGVITGLMCLSEITERQRDTIQSLAAAAILILVADPNQIFAAGFQLSFVAVLGIVCFTTPVEEFLFGLPSLADRLASVEERSLIGGWVRRYGKINISATVAAMLATAPLVAWYFHIFTPFAILSNLLVFPFVWAMVSLGALMLSVGAIAGNIAWPLAQLLNLLALLFEKLVWISSKIYFAYFYLPGPSSAWLLCCYGVLTIAACRRLLRLRRVAVWIMAALLFIIPTYMQAFASYAPELRITCLDVGHGAAFFVEFPNGRNLLYDAGTWAGHDVGERIVAPFLWSRGVRRLDALVISHAHHDHFSGVPSVGDRFNIHTALVNSRFASLPITRGILDDLRRRGAEVAEIAAGDRIAGYGECLIDVLHPPDADIVDRMSPNDVSCVLRIRWREFCFLLTGDLQNDGARILLRNFPDLRADAMQIPHHGRLSPALSEFVRTVSPEFALVNSSEDQTLRSTSLFREPGAKVYATPFAGAITLVVAADGKVSVSTYRSISP